jgi:hypothetical protein
MTDYIAELEVFFERSTHSTPGAIRVGRPWVVEADVEAKCALCLDGLIDKLPALSGADPLQALLLAVRFAGRELRRFQDEGGRILPRNGAESGSVLPLDAYFGCLAEGYK